MCEGGEPFIALNFKSTYPTGGIGAAPIAIRCLPAPHVSFVHSFFSVCSFTVTKRCTKAGHETLPIVPKKLYELVVNFEYYYLIRNITRFLSSESGSNIIILKIGKLKENRK